MSPSPSAPILPGEWLGVLGGGQLGRMFCQAAQRLGYRVAVLDPAADGPAGMLADRVIVGAYDDAQALAALAAQCRAVTTEFENVPAESLAWLAERLPVAPSADAVRVVQDRSREKAFLTSQGLPVAPYADIVQAADLDAADAGLFPGILKLARMGYDGKGQIRVTSREEARAAWRELGQLPCVLEALLPLADELSVMVVRGRDGSVRNYTPAWNEHRDGILAITVAPPPARLAAQVETVARLGRAVAEGLGYVGVLCVECFVLADGRVVVNEIAPRPHNSGHYTQDASVVSQFEQQARALAGLPLGDVRQREAGVMLNLLGELWFDAAGLERAPDWAGVLALSGVSLHLYGKTQARRGRKMGHINCTAATPAAAWALAHQVGELLNLEVADAPPA